MSDEIDRILVKLGWATKDELPLDGKAGAFGQVDFDDLRAVAEVAQRAAFREALIRWLDYDPPPKNMDEVREVDADFTLWLRERVGGDE